MTTSTSKLNPRWVSAFFAVCVLIVAVSVWLTGAVHHHSQLVDTIAYLDAAWRMHLGQVPHRDFHNLVGALPIGVTATLMTLTRPDANAMAYANSVFFVLICGFGWVLLRPRYERMVVACACLGLGFVAIAPRMLGHDVELATYAMNYNRLGWAVLGLVGLAVLQARSDEAGTRNHEWLVLGLLTMMLFFTKINFGAVSFSALLGLWAREKFQPRALLWMGVGGASVYAFCRIAWGVTLSEYLHDIHYALSVNTDTTYLKRVWGVIFANLEIGGVLLIQLVVVWSRFAALFRSSSASVWFAAGLVSSVVAFFLVAITNTHDGPIPILAVAGFALAETVRRLSLRSNFDADALRYRVLVLLSVFMLSLVSVPDAFSTARAISWHWVKKLQKQQQLHLGGVLAPVALPLQLSESPDALVASILARPPHHFRLSSAEQMAHTADALELLRAHDRIRGKILSFDLVNPFHLILATAPATGDWIAWDPMHNFNPQSHLPPERLFDQVTDVLVPKRSFSLNVANVKSQIYSTVLNRDFRLVGESKLWSLYQRTSR